MRPLFAIRHPPSAICQLANTVWWASGAGAWWAFERAARNPAKAQAALLQGYIQHNANTVFGRAHAFARLQTVADFQAAVPLATYEDYAPAIEALSEGQGQQLTADPVRLFEPSSGSTAASKLIPYTATLKREFQRGLAAWLFDLFAHDPQLLGGPAYWSVTPLTAGARYTPGGVPIGFEDDSAYLGTLGRYLAQAVLAVPNHIKQLSDMSAFRQATLLHLLAQPNLRLMSVWNPTYLTLLLATLREQWENLLATLHHAQPQRAAALARVDPADYAAIWPCLRLLSCWADGPAAPYAVQLGAQFPNVRLQGKGLLATEAFISFPLTQGAGSVLALTAHFFEFLPMGGGPPRLAHELTVGETYAVVVTTGGGFYRYQMHDLVEVVGHYAEAPRLRFVGKSDQIADWFGEKLHAHFVAQVLDEVLAALPQGFRLLAPTETEAGFCYTLFVELPAESALAEAELGGVLDAALCANFHYAYCRQLGQLAPARVCRARPDAAQAYLQACVAQGQKLGNIKPSVLQKSLGWAAVVGEGG